MAFENIMKQQGRTSRRQGPPPSFSWENIVGEIYADSIFTMPANQLPYGINVDHGNPIGSIKKREGYELLMASLGSTKMLGLNCWKHSTGDQMLAAHDKYLYLLTGTAGSISKGSQADWQAGTMDSVEATSSAGDIKCTRSTSFSETDTLAADFDGTFANTVVSGNSVVLVSDGSYTADLCTGGTAISGGYTASYTPAKAFDDNAATYWGSSQTGSAVNGNAYIGYQFAAAKHIRRIKITGLFVNTTPATIDIQRSSDGSSWTTVASASLTNPTGTQTIDLPSSGAYVYWRLLATAALTGSDYWIVKEIEMMEYIPYVSPGTYTHHVQDVSADSTSATATISFNATTPADTTLTIDVRVSTDGGANWGSWTARASGDTIIAAGTDMSNYQIQWRANLATTGTSTPSLDDVTVAVAYAYASEGSWISPVYDLTNTPSSNTITFTITEPTGTSATCYVRGSSNNTVFGDWIEALASGDSIPLQRYMQVKFVLNGASANTPTVSDFLISYSSSYTTANELDISPLGRTSNLLTGNRVRFCNYEDWCLMADGLRPFMAYITTTTQTTGTAQSGGASTIRLASGASAVTNFYTNAFITITGGTGAGQVRWISAYNGTTKDATVSAAWVTQPDNTSTYSIGSAVKVRKLGVDPPTVAPSGTAGAGTGLTGSYYYKYTFVNADGVESNPSAASSVVTVSNKNITVTIPADASAGNTTAKRRLYRTANGGSVYKYVTEIADNTTTTHTDSTADAALGSLMLDNNNIPPTVCTLLYQFTSYVFYVDGYDVWFSKAGAPDQVPNITGDMQVITFPGKVADIKAHPTALIVSGESFIATITSNSGFIFDSDPTVDTTTMKIIDSNGGLSFEASAMCLSPNLRSTLVLNTNTGLRATIPGLQDNSIESVPLSKDIQPYFERSINRDQAAGVFFNNYYLYSMEHMAPAATESERLTFVYDLRTEKWYGPWTFGMSCYAITGNVLYAGDATSGKIYRMFSGNTDAGTNIKMVADLPVRSPAGENGTCKFTQILPIVSAESDTTSTVLKPKVDDREATMNLGVLSSAFTGDVRPGHDFIRPRKKRIPLPPGHSISVRIEDDSANPLEVEKIIVEYEVTSMNR